jgi:hypothetical protein
MAKLTEADAARQLGISRTTLYKLIDQGKSTATPDGLIDDAELVHAGIASTSERLGHTRAGVQHAANHRRCERGGPAEDQTRAAGTPKPCVIGDASVTHQTRSGRGPSEGFLVDMRRSH